MKSPKKVRAKTVSAAKVKKKSTEKAKTSSSKKKTGVKSGDSKALNAKISNKTTKKADRKETTKPSQPTKAPVKVKESVAKQSANKRKSRELSGAEYDAFVVKAAKKENVSPEELVTVDRRGAKPSNTVQNAGKPAAGTTENASAKERRPKVQRRRQIDPTTCERDYSQEEIEFMNALDEYKRNSGRMFPTCSEILEVFRGLGYTKQSHEESVEISANPESGDIYITATETSTMSRSAEPRHEANHHANQHHGTNDRDRTVETDDTGRTSSANTWLEDPEEDDAQQPGITSGFPRNSTPYFL